MPCPHSLRGAGPAEVAQAVRLPGRRVHLALRRWRQRPSMDRMGIGLQAVELSPCHAGLAEPWCKRLPSVLGFLSKRLSPRPFGFR